MIRRDDPPLAAPTHWVLITQLEHARVAGVLAEHWGASGFQTLADEAVLWAAAHHDDGWQAWEQRPDVNAAGQPRSFTEMEPVDSLAIWSRSIEVALAAGPLHGAIVSGHFVALARRATVFLKHAEPLAAVEQFIIGNEGLIAEQTAVWRALDPMRNTAARAELALRQLQMFDALSLWFCCTPAGEVERLETPGGAELTLAPRAEEPGNLPVNLSPWPFRPEVMNLEIHGRRVPVRAYKDVADLAATAAQPVLLRCQLQPAARES
jgi:hypothetical protein